MPKTEAATRFMCGFRARIADTTPLAEHLAPLTPEHRAAFRKGWHEGALAIHEARKASKLCAHFDRPRTATVGNV